MTIPATFRNGVFCPEIPVSLPEGARVEVVVPEYAVGEGTRVLAIMESRFPGSIGLITPGEAEILRREIEDAFGKVDQDGVF